jgi:hypothetical protein
VEAVAGTTSGIQQRRTGGIPLLDFQTDTPEPLSEINVRLGFDVMVQIAGISLLLAFIASAMGIANITKHEPIKILMERN